jgi:hypothetical protein
MSVVTMYTYHSEGVNLESSDGWTQ